MGEVYEKVLQGLWQHPGLCFHMEKVGNLKVSIILVKPILEYCIKSIPELQGKAYYHKTSHQGWLIVIGNVRDSAEYSVAESNLDDCFLWNPVSLETVQLPKLDRESITAQTKLSSKDFYLFDLVLSSSPPSTTSNPDHEGSMVFLHFKRVDQKGDDEPCNILVFCRPGDKQWRTKALNVSYYSNNDYDAAILECIESLLCFRGKLYAFFCENWVIEIQILKLWQNVVVDRKTQYIRSFKVKDADFPVLVGEGDQDSEGMDYWVESGNEIFRVHFKCNSRSYRRVTSMHILKLDFSSLSWVLLKSLDDHVLFLCISMDTGLSRKCYSTSSACCSAADMGLERGCLFYTLLEDQTLHIFELEDSGTTAILPCLKLPTPWFLPTWIMMPTTVNRHVDGRRRRISNFMLSQSAADTIINDGRQENMSRINCYRGELQDLKPEGFPNDFDSIEAIAKFLHPVDYINFRLVCKEYSMILPALNRKSTSIRATATTYLSPWLILLFEDGEQAFCNAIDPMHNNNKYRMKVSDEFPVGATIRYSKDGWLLMSIGKKTVFCYNPFTKPMIRLPDLPDDYVLGGMSFSSTPTSRNCVVIAITNWCPWSDVSGEAKISFLLCDLHRSLSDWTPHSSTYKYDTRTHDHYMQAKRRDFMPCINNPVFYNGAFYCLDYNGLLGVFYMKGDFCWEILSKSLGQFNGIYPSFLVECDEKLLLVNLGQSGKSTEVYSLDESEMAWVKLKSLGKHAIFISYTSSFSAIAPRSFMENKIYFPRLYGEKVLYYSLDTCRYHCVGSNQYSSQDFHNTKEISNCTWIEPNWSEASLCQEPNDHLTV
ncbi:hypothetical protein MKW98_029702 [Papaver atlanticum]|uniref:KIB1-4 beta-propeller domain-containing protein n=1 Tax=Papaver atlanticum TaxID=357466 RepID=A0AAD4T6M7_9MAGN|nr:hypothetical protein MKW98_029702 [Papaver atlanticum]